MARQKLGMTEQHPEILESGSAPNVSPFVRTLKGKLATPTLRLHISYGAVVKPCQDNLLVVSSHKNATTLRSCVR